LRHVAVKRRWLQAEPLTMAGSMETVITSSAQGNLTEVVVTATYKEDGLIVDMPIFLTVRGGVPVTCTRRANSARTFFTCIGPYPPRSKIVLTTMAPNAANIGAIITSTMTHTGEQNGKVWHRLAMLWPLRLHRIWHGIEVSHHGDAEDSAGLYRGCRLNWFGHV
jgi:hypothetical protein